MKHIDLFETLASVTVLPVTSELRTAPLLRISIEPNTDNGLRKRSRVMVDKAQTVSRDKVGGMIGRLHEDTLVAVDRAVTWVASDGSSATWPGRPP
jgi:mRNA interferase MazF